MTMLSFILLYLMFRCKHFLCDYAFQNKWMVENKIKPFPAGLKSLFVHAGIHGIGTVVVFLFFAPQLWWFGIVDMFMHAAIDKAKSVYSVKHDLRPQQHEFWVAFGLDQEFHNLTNMCFIMYAVYFLGFTGTWY